MHATHHAEWLHYTFIYQPQLDQQHCWSDPFIFSFITVIFTLFMLPKLSNYKILMYSVPIPFHHNLSKSSLNFSFPCLLLYFVFSSKVNPNNFFIFYLLMREREKERQTDRQRHTETERERGWFVVLLIDAFIVCFLYVPKPGIKPTTLVNWDDTLSNWSTWPGQPQ